MSAEQHVVKFRLTFSLSLLIAMILTIIPLPHWAIHARPQWLLLVMLFWLTLTPLRVSVGTAFLVGMLQDLLTGTLLGQHAFVFSVIAYLVIKLERLVVSLPLTQQTGFVLLLAMLSLALQSWIMQMVGVFPQTWAYWLAAPMTAIIWPWLTLWLRDYRYQLKQQW